MESKAIESNISLTGGLSTNQILPESPFLKFTAYSSSLGSIDNASNNLALVLDEVKSHSLEIMSNAVTMLFDALTNSDFYASPSAQADFIWWSCQLPLESFSKISAVIVNSDNTISVKARSDDKRLSIDVLGSHQAMVAIYKKVSKCSYKTIYRSISKIDYLEAIKKIDETGTVGRKLFQSQEENVTQYINLSADYRVLEG